MGDGIDKNKAGSANALRTQARPDSRQAPVPTPIPAQAAKAPTAPLKDDGAGPTGTGQRELSRILAHDANHDGVIDVKEMMAAMDALIPKAEPTTKKQGHRRSEAEVIRDGAAVENEEVRAAARRLAKYEEDVRKANGARDLLKAARLMVAEATAAERAAKNVANPMNAERDAKVSAAARAAAAELQAHARARASALLSQAAQGVKTVEEAIEVVRAARSHQVPREELEQLLESALTALGEPLTQVKLGDALGDDQLAEKVYRQATGQPLGPKAIAWGGDGGATALAAYAAIGHPAALAVAKRREGEGADAALADLADDAGKVGSEARAKIAAGLAAAPGSSEANRAAGLLANYPALVTADAIKALEKHVESGSKGDPALHALTKVVFADPRLPTYKAALAALDRLAGRDQATTWRVGDALKEGPAALGLGALPGRFLEVSLYAEAAWKGLVDRAKGGDEKALHDVLGGVLHQYHGRRSDATAALRELLGPDPVHPEPRALAAAKELLYKPEFLINLDLHDRGALGELLGGLAPHLDVHDLLNLGKWYGRWTALEQALDARAKGQGPLAKTDAARIIPLLASLEEPHAVRAAGALGRLEKEAGAREIPALLRSEVPGSGEVLLAALDAEVAAGRPLSERDAGKLVDGLMAQVRQGSIDPARLDALGRFAERLDGPQLEALLTYVNSHPSQAERVDAILARRLATYSPEANEKARRRAEIRREPDPAIYMYSLAHIAAARPADAPLDPAIVARLFGTTVPANPEFVAPGAHPAIQRAAAKSLLTGESGGPSAKHPLPPPVWARVVDVALKSDDRALEFAMVRAAGVPGVKDVEGAMLTVTAEDLGIPPGRLNVTYWRPDGASKPSFHIDAKVDTLPNGAWRRSVTSSFWEDAGDGHIERVGVVEDAALTRALDAGGALQASGKRVETRTTGLETTVNTTETERGRVIRQHSTTTVQGLSVKEDVAGVAWLNNCPQDLMNRLLQFGPCKAERRSHWSKEDGRAVEREERVVTSADGKQELIEVTSGDGPAQWIAREKNEHGGWNQQIFFQGTKDAITQSTTVAGGWTITATTPKIEKIDALKGMPATTSQGKADASPQELVDAIAKREDLKAFAGNRLLEQFLAHAQETTKTGAPKIDVAVHEIVVKKDGKEVRQTQLIARCNGASLALGACPDETHQLQSCAGLDLGGVVTLYDAVGREEAVVDSLKLLEMSKTAGEVAVQGGQYKPASAPTGTPSTRSLKASAALASVSTFLSMSKVADAIAAGKAIEAVAAGGETAANLHAVSSALSELPGMETGVLRKFMEKGPVKGLGVSFGLIGMGFGVKGVVDAYDGGEDVQIALAWGSLASSTATAAAGILNLAASATLKAWAGALGIGGGVAGLVVLAGTLVYEYSEKTQIAEVDPAIAAFRKPA